MLTELFIFAVSIYLVIKGATMATKYAGRLAESFGLSRYAVGFIVIAVISILPETSVALNSAVSGIPSFGLGTLLGSNVADLTLVFAGVILFSGRALKVESKSLKDQAAFPFLLLLPLALGFDGYFSRLDGAALVIAGAVFYYLALRKGAGEAAIATDGFSKPRSALSLLVSMAVLLAGAHFTVSSATAIAGALGVSPVLIGMLVVGLGTTMPEFFFALKSAKRKDDSLAIGDLLGTVLADATVLVGVLALASPFHFPKNIIFVTGSFMVAAAFVLFHLMRTGRRVTKKESLFLLAYWAAFVIVELAVSRISR